MWGEGKDLETEWGCESTHLSGNPRLHTVFQSKSIDQAGLWQIIPAALHMTQSAWRIVFWWAIGLLVYQPNHPLMTASTRSLHFSKWKPKGDLEINSYKATCCLKRTTILTQVFWTFPHNRMKLRYESWTCVTSFKQNMCLSPEGACVSSEQDIIYLLQNKTQTAGLYMHSDHILAGKT